MTTNLLPISSDGGFVTAGNITSAVSASPAPTISGFSTVSADNFRLMSGSITGGVATVVDDGINSIAQAPGAQMDVFGFPFSGSGIRGQLTISDVTTPSEANGTWYYQSVNTTTYQIYTDSTYSTLVDASGWSAYTGGGTVAITKQVPAANIVINSNGYFSKFDNAGDLTLPGDLLLANNASITTTNATGNVLGKSINIQAGAADQTDYYTTAGGNLNLIGGLGAGNDGGGGGPGGSVNITSGASADVAGHNGNVTINTGGANTWTFDYTGVATLPGEGILQSIDDSLTLKTLNTSTGNANSVYLGTSGGLGFNDQAIGGNWLEIFRNGAEPEIRVPVGRGNLNIQTAQGENAYNWIFDNTGNLTLPANTFAVNYANGTAVSLGGSYGNANVAANLAAFGSNPISTTGNITTGNITASGALIRTGAITQPAWTTSGVGFQLPTAIYTDNTTAAGNLASSYIHTIGSPTIAFSNAVALTSATTLFVAAPTAGTNATIGNTFAITANGSISTTANVLIDGNIYYNGISGSIRSLPGFAGAGSNGTWGVFDHNVPTGGYKYVNVGTGQTISNSNTQIYIGSQYGICNTTVYGNLIAANNTSLGNTATITTANYQIGYRDVPQVSFTGNTTIAATDAGKHYYSTLSTANVLTIANNTSVGWSVGTAITVVNRGTANITIAQGTGVSLYLAGNSTAANRVLGTYGMATMMNVAANVWMINGTGLT